MGLGGPAPVLRSCAVAAGWAPMPCLWLPCADGACWSVEQAEVRDQALSRAAWLLLPLQVEPQPARPARLASVCPVLQALLR